MTAVTADTATRADWPARAYVYGTFDYAVSQASERAASHRLRMFLYRGVLDGEQVWVASWDPKPVTPSAEPVHWVGDAPTSLHGNGAASFTATTRHWQSVTCTLCLSLRERGDDWPDPVTPSAEGSE